MLPAILLALSVTEGQDKTAAKPTDTTKKMLIANERALHNAVADADKASFLSPRRTASWAPGSPNFYQAPSPD